MVSEQPIAILKSSLNKMGGAEKYATRIAHAFAAQGHPVTIFTSGPVTPKVSALEISTSVEPKGFSFLRVQAFDRFCSQSLQANKFSIVLGLDRNRFQTHLRASNGVHAAFLKRRASFDPMLKRLSFKFNPLHRLLLKIEKESFENPELQTLITNSYMVRDEVLDLYNVSPEKVHVVHNGVEWTECKEAFDQWPNIRSEELHKRNLPRDGFYFLFMGHNYHRKGLEYLLKGFSLVKDPHAYLIVVGKDKEPERFKQLASELGVLDRVLFVGESRNARQWFQIADATVVPSLYDPFANVTVEALAMGNFLVSSLSNGGAEVLTQNNGTLIEDLLSPDSVATALNTALQHRKTNASAELVRNSVQHLDFPNQLKSLMELCLQK